MGVKLYVGNLPYSSTDEELRALFSQAGTVSSVMIMTDRATGRSRGFAFVEMSTQEEAEEAVKRFHEANFGGRDLRVNFARPRQERNFGGMGYDEGRRGRRGSRDRRRRPY